MDGRIGVDGSERIEDFDENLKYVDKRSIKIENNTLFRAEKIGDIRGWIHGFQIRLDEEMFQEGHANQKAIVSLLEVDCMRGGIDFGEDLIDTREGMHDN